MVHLTCTVRGHFPKAEVPQPHSLFGKFLSAVASPGRLAEFRRALAAVRAAGADTVEYAHDYTWLTLDPGQGTAEVVLDHPIDDQSDSCVMPLAEFIEAADEWLAFCEQHPIRPPRLRAE
jgi:hypothetical protein